VYFLWSLWGLGTMTSARAAAKPLRRVRRGPQYSADKLMRTALELFARHDFSTVTIKDIASASGVNTALIYYYYDSKEDLFRAAIEFAIKKALERYTELREKHSEPEYLINEWFRSNLEMAKLIRQLVKIMLDYSSSETSIASVEALIKQFYVMEEQKILVESIERGMAQGIFKAGDAAKIARFVSIHLDGVMVASIIRRNFNIKRALNELRDILWLYLGLEANVSRH
jgi:AcrR family transcriptional regulator